MNKDIRTYNDSQAMSDREICNLLAKEISDCLPKAENKIWHRHPVWFLDGNPVAGYDKLKGGVRLLFWSGQSFNEEALQKEGTFKAAGFRYTSDESVNIKELRRWLKKAATIQWDYKNLIKRKGKLEPLKGVVQKNESKQPSPYGSKKFKTLDEYHTSFPAGVQKKLEQVRQTIKQAAPGATEVISYNMPAFRQNSVLVYYAAYKEHIGFYPTASPIKFFKDKLTKFNTSKGAIQFPMNKPVPVSLVKKIVKFRVTEDSVKTRTKNATSKNLNHYHKDGSIWAKGKIQGGQMHGYWEWFRKDGVIMRSGSFDKGKQVGEWTTYDRRGNVYKVTKMKAAKERKKKCDTMKSKYSFERKKNDYLYFIISGEYDKNDFLSYPKIIREACEKEKTYKVLLNALDIKETPVSTMDRFFLGEEIANVLGTEIKVAAVWHEKGINKFAETVAVNRGCNAYVSGDIETAKKWLLNNEQSE